MNKIFSRRLVLSLIFTFLTLSISTHAQSAEVEKAEIEQQKWQTRVNELTKDIVSESVSISDSERSLFLALLAKILWKADEEKARAHLKKAAQLTISGLGSDDKGDLAKRIEFAQQTIDIISKLDQKLAESSISQIAEILGDKSEANVPKENLALAELFVRFGHQIVKAKPAVALELGVKSLGYGFATSLPQLIAELNIQSPTFTEQIYRRAMTKLQRDYSKPAILFEINLSKYIFDVFVPSGFNPTTRKSFLINYSDRIAFAAQDDSSRPERCRIVSFSEPILPRIDELIPDRSLTVRQNILLCNPYISGLFQLSIGAQTRDDQPKTVDEFIKAAKDQQDEVLKGRYWRAALSRLNDEKKFAEMISILDSTDGNDLKTFAPVVWGDWRVGAASGLTKQRYDEELIPDAYRIIERTPKELRPRVRLNVAKKLSSAKKTTFYSDNLDGMIKDLSGIDMPDIESVGFYLALTELILDVRPLESESIFRLAAKFINKVDAENPDLLPEKDWEWERYYIRIDARTLEVDESGMMSSLDSISSRRSRVRLRLGLLETSLVKYHDAKKLVASLAKSGHAKGKKN